MSENEELYIQYIYMGKNKYKDCCVWLCGIGMKHSAWWSSRLNLSVFLLCINDELGYFNEDIPGALADSLAHDWKSKRPASFRINTFHQRRRLNSSRPIGLSSLLSSPSFSHLYNACQYIIFFKRPLWHFYCHFLYFEIYSLNFSPENYGLSLLALNLISIVILYLYSK